MESADQLSQYVEAKGIKLTGTPLYLDMQATTPIDPRVLDSMLPFMTEQYGNPHSRTHFYGWESEDAVEVARKQVRALAVPSSTCQPGCSGRSSRSMHGSRIGHESLQSSK